MDKQVSIREAKITISPEERELILSFFKRLKSQTNAMPNMVPVLEMYFILNGHANDTELRKLMPDGKLVFYVNEKDKNRGTYDDKTSTIYINMDWAVLRRYDIDKGELKSTYKDFISGLNYSKIISTFVHEYIHYKQHHVALKTIPKGSPTLTSKKPYLRQPIEQQAWAAEYLEFIKQQLPHITDDGIVARLKRLGVTDNPQLEKLKTVDYTAWRAIMKRIVGILLQEPSKKL